MKPCTCCANFSQNSTLMFSVFSYKLTIETKTKRKIQEIKYIGEVGGA